MTQVGAAFGAHNFGTDHTMRFIDFGFNRAGRGIPKCRPASARIVFGARIKKFLAANNTVVRAGGEIFVIFSRAWRLGALEKTNIVLFRRQFGSVHRYDVNIQTMKWAAKEPVPHLPCGHPLLTQGCGLYRKSGS